MCIASHKETDKPKSCAQITEKRFTIYVLKKCLIKYPNFEKVKNSKSQN